MGMSTPTIINNKQRWLTTDLIIIIIVSIYLYYCRNKTEKETRSWIRIWNYFSHSCVMQFEMTSSPYPQNKNADFEYNARTVYI